MNEQDKFMILVTDEFVKYKKKYKSLLEEFEDYKKRNKAIIKLPNYDILKKMNMEYILDNVFYNRLDERIHPNIKQIIENNKITLLTDDEIINNALVNAFKTQIFKNHLSSSLIIFDKNNYIKKARDSELRNVSTDFVNSFFLSSDDKFYGLIINFYNILSNAIRMYIDNIEAEIVTKYGIVGYNFKDNIKLIFKGGNILKAVFLNYKYQMPGNLADEMSKLFDKYFSRSDLDFQIVIYPKFTADNIKNEEIYEELVGRFGILVYWVINEFRKNYLFKLDETFDFYQFNNTIKISKLKYLKDQLNNTLGKMQEHKIFEQFLRDFGGEFIYYKNMKIKNIFFNYLCSNQEELNDYSRNIKTNYVDVDIIKNTLQSQNYFFNFREDVYIEDKVDSSNNVLLVKTINSEDNFKSEHYLTYIKNLFIENKKTGLIRSFSLLRLKINFLAEFTSEIAGQTKYGAINIPGELIDVSISKFNDSKIKLFDTKNISDIYGEYYFKKINFSPFKFYSYKFEYLTLDLYEVIYSDNDFPWEDFKFEKRLNRLLFLSIVELFSLSNNELNLSEFIKKIKEISGENVNNIVSNRTYFEDKMRTIVNPNIKKLFLFKILDEHAKIFDKKNIDEDENFKKYYESILNLLKEVNLLLKSLYDFCSRTEKGKLNVNDDSFRKINQIGGKKTYTIKNNKKV